MTLPAMIPWVICLNLAGATVSLVLTMYVAIWVTSWRSGPLLRLGLILAGTLACVYIVSYIWLLVHPDEILVWTNNLRYVMAISWWFGPWTALPLAILFQVKKLSQTMKEEAQQLISEYSLEAEESNVDYTGFDSRPDDS